MESVAVARVLHNHTAAVNSLDFSKDGEFLLSSGNDRRICLYKCTEGMLQRLVVCAKYGACLARFTHDPLSIILTGTAQGDSSIRYMSLHDNRYLRSFSAHTAAVVCVDMSPKEDLFTSASMDGTIRLWDLRSPDCQGVMRSSDSSTLRSAVAFDPTGAVLASAVNGQVWMYDVRMYDQGPFLTASPGLGTSAHSISTLRFSNDGKYLLAAMAGAQVTLLDAYTGTVLQEFLRRPGERRLPLECCFSPDSEFVVGGSEDGAIWRWRTSTGEAMKPMQGHAAPVGAVQCNPTRMMMASACSAVALWLPTTGSHDPLQPDATLGAVC